MTDNTILALDIIVIQQLLIESLEQFSRTPQYRQKKVNLIKSLIKELEKDTVSDYNKAFGLDEETLITVQQNYQFAIESFSSRNIPDKVAMSQLLMAWSKDRSGMEANVFRILNKRN